MMYLLRVGADTTEAGGGFRSPIFQDRRYLFVPIPEPKNAPAVRQRVVTYRDFRWMDRPVLRYIPQGMAEQIIHNDPEFRTPSYGSPRWNRNGSTEKNYNRLSSMQRGDIIVFYAGFIDEFGNAGLYFFAYLVVQQSITYHDPGDLPEEVQARVAGNHHFLHGYMDQVIVVGNHDLSRVFNRVVLLSGPGDTVGANHYPAPEVVRITGYRESMNLSSLRRIESVERANDLKTYLDERSA